MILPIEELLDCGGVKVGFVLGVTSGIGVIAGVLVAAGVGDERGVVFVFVFSLGVAVGKGVGEDVLGVVVGNGSFTLVLIFVLIFNKFVSRLPIFVFTLLIL